MKNTILKLLEYIYYFSLVILFTIYLFPGSLIGYFLYGNLGQQPNLIPNPMGTSINHLIFFSYITILVLIIRQKVKNILTDYKIILFISFILEILHFIIPNRAFEFYDLIANMLGVLIIIFIKRFIND
jgi:VanZ family protein